MAGPAHHRLSRRRLLGGGAALGAVGLGAAGLGASLRDTSPLTTTGGDTVPFFGEHQAGIATSPQSHCAFVTFDLAPHAGRSTLAGLLRSWTQDASRLAAGTPALGDTEPELAALPARLTVTIGLGAGTFTAIGAERQLPTWAGPLPRFSVDRLEPAWSGGDLLLQVCADDAVTVAHAVRTLSKSVRSLASVHSVQRGFRRSRGSEPVGTTMRNLMGQVDGTVNADSAGPEFAEQVWCSDPAYPWLVGGTSLVVRRIRMELDTWDELGRTARELTVGRRIHDGSPLTGTTETDTPDFAATDRFGISVIPPSAHIARAQPAHPQERFFRRGYNYDDPPDAGLIFTAYQANIATQFTPVQQRLADFDALNAWTTPIGSAVFLLPPGCRPGEYLGQPLLEGL